MPAAENRIELWIARGLALLLVGGMLSGYIIGSGDLDITRFHPDYTFHASPVCFLVGVVSWVILFLWTLRNTCRCSFPPSRDLPRYQREILWSVLIGFLLFLLLGMMYPCISRLTNRKFALYFCGSFMQDRVDAWHMNLKGDHYPELTMQEIFQAWLNDPPSNYTPRKWRETLEFHLTRQEYRNRPDRDRLPNEADFVYIYAGAGHPIQSGGKIIFYEKPGMHRLGGDIRNVIYADGVRSEAISPENWHTIEQQLHRSARSAQDCVFPPENHSN